MDAAQFFQAGWARFAHDAAVADWAARARAVARACLADARHRARWLRCGGTWLNGVSLFPNDAAGAVPEAGAAPRRWAAEDVTDAYVEARRECFERCRRVPVHARPGEAYLIHRLALHGVAPWQSEADGERMVAYFRPDAFPGADPGWWLERP